MFKWLLRAVLAGLMIGVGWFAVTVTGHVLHTSPFFNVQAVEVRGAVHTDIDKLKQLYLPLVGRNIFMEIKPEELATDDPWIRRLEIRRSYSSKQFYAVVTEEKELLSYKRGDKCSVITEGGLEIPTDCGGVKIQVANSLLNSEFQEFLKLYADNEFLQESEIVLRSGFFTVKNGGTEFTCAYSSDIFNANYVAYVDKISPRYAKVYSVDVSVRGKVYVKGEMNG